MPSFSKMSKEKLNTCHKDLIILMDTCIRYYDFTVLEGYRSIERQQMLYKEGRSKLDGIHKKSKHNYSPSLAVDIITYHKKYPHYRWNDIKSAYFLGGLVKGIAADLYSRGIISHKIRWGGDWDSDNDFNDQTFNDLVHFELL